MSCNNRIWLISIFIFGFFSPIFLFPQSGAVETTVIREDYSVRIDGSYRGYQSREIYGRSFPAGVLSGLPKRETSWYGTAAFRRESNYSAKELTINLEALYLIDPELGEIAIPGEQKPLRLNIPFILQDSEEPAGLPKVWKMIGSDMFLFNERAISVDTQVVYTDQGLVIAEGRSARQINYRYPLRIQNDKVRILGLADSIRELFGSVTGTLYLYQDDAGGAFMKERILRRIVQPDGSLWDEEGFRLIWQESVVEGAFEQVVQKIAQDADIGTRENEPDGDTDGAAGVDGGDSGGGDGQAKKVVVERRPEGVVLTLPDIYFIPDQAEILPDEWDRLNRLADALKKVDTKHFLVVGHTADVGSRESQLELSKERAKVIVEEMVARGLAPGRFLHDGVGGSEPVGSNETEEGRRKNRRVEVLLLD